MCVYVLSQFFTSRMYDAEEDFVSFEEEELVSLSGHTTSVLLACLDWDDLAG